MGYARHIGRVGALAITLGVGVALGSAPVAFAEPSSPSSASETSSADDSSSKDGAEGGGGGELAAEEEAEEHLKDFG